MGESLTDCVICRWEIIEHDGSAARKINVEKLQKEIRRGRISYTEAFLRKCVCDSCFQSQQILEKISAHQAHLASRKSSTIETAPQSNTSADTKEKKPSKHPAERWESFNPNRDAPPSLEELVEYFLNEEILAWLRLQPNHVFLDTPYWRAIRQFALEFGDKCERCGRCHDLDVHRLATFEPSWDVEDLARLEVVCLYCCKDHEQHLRVDIRSVQSTGKFRVAHHLPGQQTLTFE